MPPAAGAAALPPGQACAGGASGGRGGGCVHRGEAEREGPGHDRSREWHRPPPRSRAHLRGRGRLRHRPPLRQCRAELRIALVPLPGRAERRRERPRALVRSFELRHGAQGSGDDGEGACQDAGRVRRCASPVASGPPRRHAVLPESHGGGEGSCRRRFRPGAGDCQPGGAPGQAGPRRQGQAGGRSGQIGGDRELRWRGPCELWCWLWHWTGLWLGRSHRRDVRPEPYARVAWPGASAGVALVFCQPRTGTAAPSGRVRRAV
mmetsp:Transcript_7956/g.29773  ORF Transcript_7956/g.29773 Transcript_7956/m.29773 type:complete len:263 (+) Transcript_7956:579-1367(+)